MFRFLLYIRIMWGPDEQFKWNGAHPVPGGESAYIRATTSARWPFNATMALLLGIGLGALVIGFIADDGGLWNIGRRAVFEYGRNPVPRLLALIVYSWVWLVAMAIDLALLIAAAKYLPREWPWAKTKA